MKILLRDTHNLQITQDHDQIVWSSTAGEIKAIKDKKFKLHVDVTCCRKQLYHLAYTISSDVLSWHLKEVQVFVKTVTLRNFHSTTISSSVLFGLIY